MQSLRLSRGLHKPRPSYVAGSAVQVFEAVVTGVLGVALKKPFWYVAPPLAQLALIFSMCSLPDEVAQLAKEPDELSSVKQVAVDHAVH